MNWTNFLLWVAGIYFLYYLVNILIDATEAKRTAASSLTNELSFSEQVEPVQLQHGAIAVASTKKRAVTKEYAPEVFASGGVPMGDICNLARRNLINYTGAVSF